MEISPSKLFEYLISIEETEECKLYYQNLKEIAAIEEFKTVEEFTQGTSFLSLNLFQCMR